MVIVVLVIGIIVMISFIIVVVVVVVSLPFLFVRTIVVGITTAMITKTLETIPIIHNNRSLLRKLFLNI